MLLSPAAVSISVPARVLPLPKSAKPKRAAASLISPAIRRRTAKSGIRYNIRLQKRHGLSVPIHVSKKRPPKTRKIPPRKKRLLSPEAMSTSASARVLPLPKPEQPKMAQNSFFCQAKREKTARSGIRYSILPQKRHGLSVLTQGLNAIRQSNM